MRTAEPQTVYGSGFRTLVTAAVATPLVCLLVFAANANAVVYWQTQGVVSSSFNRANLDKQPPETVQMPFTKLPPGVEISDLTAHGGFIYWIDETKPAIGRMRADGALADPSFLPIDTDRTDVAVNSSGIYWTRPSYWTQPGPVSSNTIARADLDGGNVNPRFIDPSSVHEVSSPLAASETHLYWVGEDPDLGQDQIARANTDGSGVNTSFVSPPSSSAITALAASDAHIYWTDQGTSGAGIGRAGAGGSDVNPFFADGEATGGSVFDLAVGGPYLFWAASPFETVGRMSLDGTGANPRFITSPNDDILNVIAADPLVIPIASISKFPKKTTEKRKARIAFNSPNAPDASFQCKLDKKAYKPCSSPATVKVSPGRHKFLVKAANATGPSPYPARAKWKVVPE